VYIRNIKGWREKLVVGVYEGGGIRLLGRHDGRGTSTKKKKVKGDIPGTRFTVVSCEHGRKYCGEGTGEKHIRMSGDYSRKVYADEKNGERS